MKYAHFQVNDFATDTFFQQWVRAPDEFTNIFWEQWMKEHPEKRDTIRQARILLQSMEIQEVRYSKEDFDEVKHNIKSQLFGNHEQQASKKIDTLIPFQKVPWLKLAAGVSGLVILSFYLLHYWMPQAEMYSTGNSEQTEVALPDGSRVLLNANTILKVSNDWDEEREVWLKGEAYFEVEKIKEASRSKEHSDFRKFTVHAEEIDIEVLGTSFNVLDRRNVTLVVLQEGVVELRKKQLEKASLRMQAGELVSYSNQDQSFERKRANIRTILGWKDGKHTFEATPLKAIGMVIEDIYGLEVKVESEELGKRRFSASVPYGELDLLLKLISESMQVEVKKKEDIILISKSN